MNKLKKVNGEKVIDVFKKDSSDSVFIRTQKHLIYTKGIVCILAGQKLLYGWVSHLKGQIGIDHLPKEFTH